MQEAIAQVLQHVRASWRYRWFIALVAWPLCIAGWIYVHSLPDQYQASARVYLDTQSMLRPLLRGLAVQSNAQSEVELMTRTLLSRQSRKSGADDGPGPQGQDAGADGDAAHEDARQDKYRRYAPAGTVPHLV